MKNEELKTNEKQEKKSFRELWKDKKERAKIELILYGVFFVGVIIFARVFGGSVNNTNNDNTDNSTFLSLIDDNYEYNIVVNMNDNVYEYYGKVLGNNSTINVKVLDDIKSYYLKSDKYYVLEDNNYILVNEEEVYPYINKRYFGINNINSYMKIGTKEDNVYKININDVIFNSDSSDYFTITINEDNKNIVIDYTNLFKVTYKDISNVIVNITYSNIGNVISIDE